MSFGENVGFYRKQLSITQEELAERLFVSRQTVSRWETDSTFPDVETIIKLCDAFGCDMDTLVRGNAQDVRNTLKKHDEVVDSGADTVEEIKKELKRKRRISERLMGGIAGTLAIVTVLAYLLCGFLGDLWHPMWLLFVCFGAICAISSIVIDAVLGISSEAKRLSDEKKKLRK